MSVSVSLSDISNLINISTDVGYWYDVDDISATIGSFINNLSSRYVTNNATVTGTNVFTFQYDSEGYKCLSQSDTKYFAPNTAITVAGNECFILVMNVKTSGSFVGLGAMTNNNFVYAGNNIVYSSPVGKKIILVGTLTSTRMEFWVNNILVGFVNNPSTTGVAGNNRVFGASVNSSFGQLDFYTAIYLKNVPSADKLKKLVRLISFQHGIKI